MPSLEPVVLNLIGQIYDAAADPRLWPAFLENFADVVHGVTTSIFLFDGERREGNIAATVRIAPDQQRQYDEYYSSLDCWGAGGLHLISGNIATGQMLCPDDVLDRSEFHNDFLRHINAFHQFCGVIEKNKTTFSMIASLRPKTAGPFDEGETRLLELLMPHLQRALQLHEKMVVLDRKVDLASQLLDRLAIGCLIVGAQSNVLLMNRKAKEVLDQNDGLSLVRDGLCSVRSEDTQRLRAMIYKATETSVGRGVASGGVVQVARPSLRKPFQVVVTPLRWSAGILDTKIRPAAAVFLTDPETGLEPPQQILSGLFGFTEAESRLAAKLMEGMSLREAADYFCKSHNTVKTQLQAIFNKTGTNRQSELVRLLWRGPAGLNFK